MNLEGPHQTGQNITLYWTEFFDKDELIIFCVFAGMECNRLGNELICNCVQCRPSLNKTEVPETF